MDEEAPSPKAVSQAQDVLVGSGTSKGPEALAAISSSSCVPNTGNGLAQKREFLWKVHSYTNDHIRFADTKAAFCVGIASALMGALFASKSHELFTKALTSQDVGHRTFLACVSLGAFVLLAISMGTAVTVVRPRLWTHSEKGFIFWGAVSKFDAGGAFAAQFAAQTEAELNECLSHHLYSLAKVCRRKYIWLIVAILTAAVGGAFAVVVLLFKH